MKNRITKATVLASFSSALLLAGCGGGGGGSAALAPEVSTITTQNATDVAAQAYSAATAVNNQVTGGTAILTGVQVSPTGAQNTGLANATITQLYRALTVKPANLAVGITGSDTYACPSGGTVTVSYNVANQSVVSNGDTLSITGNNCVEDGVVMNGGVTITFSNLSGTPSATAPWSATMAITYRDFTVAANGVSDKANGDLTLAYTLAASGTETSVASGTSLQMSTTRTGGATVSRTLTAYEDFGEVTAAGLFTFRSNYTLAGNLPRLAENFVFTVRTTTDFMQQGTSFPYQGVMVVTAKDKTSLTLTVLDANSVQIAIDNNGDNVVDVTVTKTWSELMAAL